MDMSICNKLVQIQNSSFRGMRIEINKKKLSAMYHGLLASLMEKMRWKPAYTDFSIFRQMAGLL
ncbi:hypothetical protein [Undibacterium sp. TJN19]|uniref:hypothetical protein n=1 Tax=Undibacterium sp. TJN19 TaxID=3413055 RepID=UPI003BF2A033